MTEHIDTLVNILTVLGILVAAQRGWLSRARRNATEDEAIKQRVGKIEEWIEGHQICSDKQIEILQEVREGLAFIKGQLEGK